MKLAVCLLSWLVMLALVAGVGYELALARMSHLSRPLRARVTWYGREWWQCDGVRAVAILAALAVVLAGVTTAILARAWYAP